MKIASTLNMAEIWDTRTFQQKPKRAFFEMMETVTKVERRYMMRIFYLAIIFVGITLGCMAPFHPKEKVQKQMYASDNPLHMRCLKAFFKYHMATPGMSILLSAINMMVCWGITTLSWSFDPLSQMIKLSLCCWCDGIDAGVVVMERENGRFDSTSFDKYKATVDTDICLEDKHVSPVLWMCLGQFNVKYNVLPTACITSCCLPLIVFAFFGPW